MRCNPFAILTGQEQDTIRTVLQVSPLPEEVAVGEKDKPLVSMSKEERENEWDDVYVKEEGTIIEFDPRTKTGKVRSLRDGGVYSIDNRELVRTKIELRQGNKVQFAPIEDPDGKNYARIVKLMELGK
jgi:hypothetical protein